MPQKAGLNLVCCSDSSTALFSVMREDDRNMMLLVVVVLLARAGVAPPAPCTPPADGKFRHPLKCSIESGLKSLYDHFLNIVLN